nr:neurotrypsin-like [Lytechinus pictus]
MEIVHASSLPPWILFSLVLLPAHTLAVNNSIRLYGGYSDKDGVVHVNVLGVWKAICSDEWDALDAMVTCRHLGFTEGYSMFSEEKKSHSHYYYDQTEPPSSTFPIGGNHFACNGNEKTLLSCNHSANIYCRKLATAACDITDVTYGEVLSNVNPYGDSGVFHYTINTSDGKSHGLVLVTSSHSYDHIFPTGGICDMDQLAAMRICERHGYSNGGERIKVDSPEGLPILFSKVSCNNRHGWGLDNCDTELTQTGACPQGIKYNGVTCYTDVRPYVIGALLFAGVSSVFIFLVGACSIHFIRKDRKIRHTTLVNEQDDFTTSRPHPDS